MSNYLALPAAEATDIDRFASGNAVGRPGRRQVERVYVQAEVLLALRPHRR